MNIMGIIFLISVFLIINVIYKNVINSCISSFIYNFRTIHQEQIYCCIMCLCCWG